MVRIGDRSGAEMAVATNYCSRGQFATDKVRKIAAEYSADITHNGSHSPSSTITVLGSY